MTVFSWTEAWLLINFHLHVHVLHYMQSAAFAEHSTQLHCRSHDVFGCTWSNRRLLDSQVCDHCDSLRSVIVIVWQRISASDCRTRIHHRRPMTSQMSIDITGRDNSFIADHIKCSFGFLCTELLYSNFCTVVPGFLDHLFGQKNIVLVTGDGGIFILKIYIFIFIDLT